MTGEHDGKTIDDLVWLGESDETSDADDSFGKVTQSEDERRSQRSIVFEPSTPKLTYYRIK